MSQASSHSSLPSPDPDPIAEQAKRLKRFKILATAAILTAVLGGIYWLAERNWETTDDAFVEGSVAQISPQVAGRVTAVYFDDNATVKAGDALVDLDPRDAQAALENAQANLAAAQARQLSAQANLDLVRVTAVESKSKAADGLRQAMQIAQQTKSQIEATQAEVTRTAADVKRYADLFESHNISRQRLEQAQADARSADAGYRAQLSATAAAESQIKQAEAELRSSDTTKVQFALREADVAAARAQVDQAQAAVATARLTLSYTHIVAPQAGRLTKKSVAVGDYILANQTLTGLVVGAPWVVANFKENQLARMKPGQKVKIHVDALPGTTLTGQVESVQPGTGARFALLPAENATGNYIKVVQRVPVKISLDNPASLPFLPLGLSVVPDVDLSSGPS